MQYSEFHNHPSESCHDSKRLCSWRKKIMLYQHLEMFPSSAKNTYIYIYTLLYLKSVNSRVSNFNLWSCFLDWFCNVAVQGDSRAWERKLVRWRSKCNRLYCTRWIYYIKCLLIESFCVVITDVLTVWIYIYTSMCVFLCVCIYIYV